MSITVKKQNLLLALLILLVLKSTSSLAAISCTFTSNLPSTVVDMGTFDPYNYTNIVVPVTLTITCSSGKGDVGKSLNYTYTFSAGGSGNMNARRMALNTNYVNYGICTTTGCTQNYGNGSQSTYIITNSYKMPSNPRSDSWILYFVVPVQPLSVPGTYTDSLVGTFTLNW